MNMTTIEETQDEVCFDDVDSQNTTPQPEFSIDVEEIKYSDILSVRAFLGIWQSAEC